LAKDRRPLETFATICSVLDTSADFLLGISDDLPFKMAGSTEEQIEGILQFILLIEQANKRMNDQ